MVIINQALKRLDKCHGTITDQQAAVEVNIHNSFQRLQEILDVRKAQLISQLHQIIQSKLKSLEDQKSQLTTTQAQIKKSLDSVKKIIKKDPHHVLKMRTNTTKQVEELSAPIQPDLLLPCTEADLQYSGSADTLADCRLYGHLSGPSLDPSKCNATGYALEVASMVEESTVSVQAVSYKGEPFCQPIAVECYLVSEVVAGTKVLGRVERTGQSIYKVSYQPTVKGKHSLHIKVDGQHIKGSPFSVTALESSIQKIGASVHSTTEVNGPHSVTLNREQELVISGVRDHSLHVLNFKTMSRWSLRSRGEIRFPMGVTTDKDGNILLVDSGNHCALKLTAKGQILDKGKEQLCKSPYGITFNSTNNKVYITDMYNHCVQVLNSDLTFFSSFGSHGNGKGQFTCPQGITCDGAGNVYVTENHRVQVFTAEGRFLRTFGRYGQGEGELNFASGVAVDANGLVYVSEANNHRVSVFTPGGLFVKAFGKCGRKPGQFVHPRGLAVDSKGVVYVCDIDNNRIQMF